ncbi:MAG: DUF72 domain-containing protein [Candidatus Aminicenantes bacterium]|nr:DUF72 domain-containing protein [Candidatus Aminicenantes bacterium]
MKFQVGTSGWSYRGWRGLFYPEDLSPSQWLAFYSQYFSTVEINMTFYRFPKPETMEHWAKLTPDNFAFSLKANRRITHLKKLREIKADLRYMYILAQSLGKKLGCLLFQLPPSLRIDLPLLEDFLAQLETRFLNVIEFRHPSWYNEAVYDLLRQKKVILCLVSSKQVPPKMVVTSSTAYVRFHGLTAGYRYFYSDSELEVWAANLSQLPVKEIFIYFNNDYRAHAVQNGLRLRSMLENKVKVNKC